MSKQRKLTLSDFDKYLKPIHLGGKQHTLTVTHVGAIKMKSREREYIIAGDDDEVPDDELQMILHFREFHKFMRVNATNRDVIRKVVGDDLASLVGGTVTIRPITLKQFGGRESIDIVSCTRGKGAPAQTPEPVREEGWSEPEADELPAEAVAYDRQARGRYLIELRAQIKTQGGKLLPLTAEQTQALSNEDLEHMIEMAELSIADLKAAKS